MENKKASSPRRKSGAIAPQEHLYLHHNLDSGVKPRNDTYKNVRNQYTNNIHKIKTRNNVRKNKINIQPVVIPGRDPGIQVCDVARSACNIVTPPRLVRGGTGSATEKHKKNAPWRVYHITLPWVG